LDLSITTPSGEISSFRTAFFVGCNGIGGFVLD
jgi:hypothetical protein